MKETERRAGTVNIIMRSPFALVVVVAAAILAGEVLIMLILPSFISADSAYNEIADGLLLVILLVPVLHYLVYLPFVRQIREARESAQKFYAVMQTAVDAVVSITPSGEIIYWNKAAEKMFGHAESEAVGKAVDMLIPKRFGDAHRRGLARVAAGGPYRLVGKTVTIEGLRKDGAEFPLDLSLSAWESGGKRYFTGIIRDITERKRQEAELGKLNEDLKELLNEYNRFFNLVPDMVCEASADGYFLKVNSMWQTVLGYSEQELLATSFLDFIHPDDRDATMKEVERQIRGEATFGLVNRYRCKDGGYRWLEWVASPSPDGKHLFAAARDITERKAAADKLRASEMALSKAQQLAHLGNWELDFQTGKTIWSDEIYNIYGLVREETEPTFDRFIGLVHPEDRKIVEETLSTVKQLKVRQCGFEMRIIRPDGNERVLAGTLEVITDKEGKPSKLIGINQDITERKVMENTVIRSKRLASVGILSAGVAHEILNPLNIISTTAQLTMMDEPTGPIHEKMGEILGQIQRAVKIVKNLGMFASKIRMEVQDMPLASCFDQAASSMETDLKANNIIIERHFDPATSSIKGDAIQLEQVFSILISNARDAMKPRGNGTITVTSRPVERGVESKFCDDGPGIPADIIEKVFDPFFTTKDPGKGTGLGLSIAHRIIEDHGGTLSVESEAGKGVCFTIFLPKDGGPVAAG